MLWRRDEQKLEAWKSDPSHGLLAVTGSPQVGKTTLVESFGRAQYHSFIKIDLASSPAARAVFKQSNDLLVLLANISSFTRKELVPEGTLVFLDNLHMYPKALAAAELLASDPRFDCIVAYPLSSFASTVHTTMPTPSTMSSPVTSSFEDTPSSPNALHSPNTAASPIQELRIFPLTFEEFVRATPQGLFLLQEARQSIDDGNSIDTKIHEQLNDYYNLYMGAGGMPAVVQTLLKAGDFSRAEARQKSLFKWCKQYIDESTRNLSHALHIFESIPYELAKKNKRFMLSNLTQSARMERYAQDFDWLVSSGLCLECTNTSRPVAPLNEHVRDNLFKLFFYDCGLFSSRLAPTISFALINGIHTYKRNRKLNTQDAPKKESKATDSASKSPKRASKTPRRVHNKRSRSLTDADFKMLFEGILQNAFAQEFTANGFALRYFEKTGYGSADFLLDNNDYIIPVSIARSSHKVPANLKKLLDNPAYDLEEAIVFTPDNYSFDATDERVTFLPFYVSTFLTA